MLAPDAVRNVLSLMLSCGLYNYSGDFAFKVIEFAGRSIHRILQGENHGRREGATTKDENKSSDHDVFPASSG